MLEETPEQIAGIRINADLFWSKVATGAVDECWDWTGSINYDGYGQFGARADGKTKMFRAHRLAFVLAGGDIPKGLFLDHLCRNRRCCNPAHLEAVTSKENTLRGVGHTAVNAAKTVCSKGHPLSGENLSIVKSQGRSTMRVCRTCRKKWRAECSARRRAKQRAVRATLTPRVPA